MGHLRLLGLLVVVSFTSNLLTGCSSDSGGVAPASYTGNMAQASITSENGQEMVDTTIDGASGGAGSNASASSSGQTADKEQLLGLGRSLSSVVKGMDPSNASSSQSIAAVQSESDTHTSPCGGTLSYSSTYDDVTGDFSFSATANEYVDCDDNSILSGAFSMSATGRAYDASALEYYYASATLTFDTLTYKDGTESMTMTGDVSMSMSSATTYTMTMNFDFRDNVANETFRVENYVANITEDATGMDMSISGKVYHHVHGYVTITTTTPLRVNHADDYPSAGVIELVGAGGSKARVTFNPGGTYTLEIDSDGDSTYETTKSCTWSTDTCS